MFCKFPSIVNSYHEKTLKFWLEKYPELKNERFVAETKIDGASISFVFSKDEEMKVYSRERYISPNENFFDVWNVIKGEYCQHVFGICKAYVEKYGLASLQITGELFGQGIQKRINYGKEKYIIFYSVSINGYLQPPLFCYNFFPYSVCINAVHDNLSLEDALNFDVENLKDFYSMCQDTAEGIVIKPYNKVYVSPVGDIFYLKKKNEKFNDRAKVKEDVAKFSDEVIRLNLQYKSFLTENRLQDLFSKYNIITDQSQLGTYIKLMREDAINDFMKDFGDDFNKLEKKEQKAVFNVGNVIAKMFQKHI